MPEELYSECCRCREVKPAADFNKDRGRSNGLHGYCRDCQRAKHQEAARKRAKEWAAENPERYRANQERWKKENRSEIAAYMRERNIRVQYGISIDEYEAIVARPCAICGGTERIVLDHCHKTGKVRAGLCSACNSGIGMLGDDIDRLRAALAYLEEHQ